MRTLKTFLRVLNSYLPVENYSTPHQIKASYVSGIKIFERRFIGIYRHLLSKYSENAVLECLEIVQYKFFF